MCITWGCHLISTFLARMSPVQEHIASKRYIHMDLAARNVLVGVDNSCRIADFGLSRRLPRGKDCWRPRQVMKVSPKWAAIECLDERTFSVESDVWATGVTMWEVMSCVRSELRFSRSLWPPSPLVTTSSVPYCRRPDLVVPSSVHLLSACGPICTLLRDLKFVSMFSIVYRASRHMAT